MEAAAVESSASGKHKKHKKRDHGGDGAFERDREHKKKRKSSKSQHADKPTTAAPVSSLAATALALAASAVPQDGDQPSMPSGATGEDDKAKRKLEKKARKEDKQRAAAAAAAPTAEVLAKTASTESQQLEKAERDRKKEAKKEKKRQRSDTATHVPALAVGAPAAAEDKDDGEEVTRKKAKKDKKDEHDEKDKNSKHKAEKSKSTTTTSTSTATAPSKSNLKAERKEKKRLAKEAEAAAVPAKDKADAEDKAEQKRMRKAGKKVEKAEEKAKKDKVDVAREKKKVKKSDVAGVAAAPVAASPTAAAVAVRATIAPATAAPRTAAPTSVFPFPQADSESESESDTDSDAGPSSVFPRSAPLPPAPTLPSLPSLARPARKPVTASSTPRKAVPENSDSDLSDVSPDSDSDADPSSILRRGTPSLRGTPKQKPTRTLSDDSDSDSGGAFDPTAILRRGAGIAPGASVAAAAAASDKARTLPASLKTVITGPAPVKATKRATTAKAPTTAALDDTARAKPGRKKVTPESLGKTQAEVDGDLKKELSRNGAMDEFLASKWIKFDELIRLENAGVLTYKRGRFTEAERTAMRTHLDTFKRIHNLTEEALVSIAFAKGRTSERGQYEKFFPELAACVPGRPVKYVKEAVKRMIDPSGRQGRWTSDEDQALLAAYMQHPNEWSKIALNVGRSEIDCRDRYRGELVDRDSRNSGRWSKDEEERLKAAVLEAQSALGADPLMAKEVPWTVIVAKMGGDRGWTQCRQKWEDYLLPRLREQAAREAGAAKLGPAELTDDVIIARLRESGVRHANDVGMSKLLGPEWAVGQDLVSRRWKTMKARVDGAEKMGMDELLTAIEAANEAKAAVKEAKKAERVAEGSAKAKKRKSQADGEPPRKMVRKAASAASSDKRKIKSASVVPSSDEEDDE